MVEINKDEVPEIKLNSNSYAGNSSETVVEHEWTVNNNILPDKNEIITIGTSSLPLGENTISVRAKNSCGNWSLTSSLVINITEGKHMQKSIQIDINQPIIEVEVIMDDLETATVKVTVKKSGNPVQNAAVSIESITSTTDASGLAVLNSVPYGNNKTLTVII